MVQDLYSIWRLSENTASKKGIVDDYKLRRSFRNEIDGKGIARFVNQCYTD